MNTYVMGEIAVLLAISVLAGILIGWCIKSLLFGRQERQVRNHISHDIDGVMADMDQMRKTVDRKDDQLKERNRELQQMRGRDVSMKAGNTAQVDEINKLKNELAVARQSLDRNRSEFNSYRNDRQNELQSLNNKLASFKSGGNVHDERMTEANETITALRTATRENDRVIESLRARVKEGETTVESMRNQLQTAESSANRSESSQKSAEASMAKLTASLTDTTAERDKLKRDYENTLASKNNEIVRQQTRLEELGKINTEFQGKEHELTKLQRKGQEDAKRASEQIAELKQTIANREADRAAYLKDQSRMQQQIATLQADNSKLLNSTDKESSESSALKTKVENKSAEVVALNDMLRDVSNKRNDLQAQVGKLEKQLQSSAKDRQVLSASQSKLAAVTTTLQERDSIIAKLRNDMDGMVENRNRLSIEYGDLQRRRQQDKASLKGESEQQLAQMVNTLKERDHSFEKLSKDMDDMSVSRDRLTAELRNLQNRGTELENFKKDMQTAVANRDSELEQRKIAYQKLQTEFTNLSKVRDDYERRIDSLKTEVQQQSVQLREQEKNSQLEINKLQPQLAEMRTRLSLADTENQKISAGLSDTAAMKLALTEKESVIQKLQIEVQDAKLGSNADQSAQQKIDSLTSALRDRDTELGRLNSTITDNRLTSQKTTSEINLLKQEVESQSKLIKDLNEQSENTLSLHKKIAEQSTEIEELRVSLYNGEAPADNAQELRSLQTKLQQQISATEEMKKQLTEARQEARQEAQQTATQANTNAADQQRIASLQSQLDSRNADINKLQQVATAYRELQTGHQKLQQDYKNEVAKNKSSTTTPRAAASTANTARRASVQNKAAEPASSSAKPRVFLRPDSSTASMESLTGATGSYETKRTATYTRDGYRIKHLNGQDDLTLLPGIDSKAEQELNKHGVSEFEQIALWGKREVLHFAERSGITPATAENFNWPKLAAQILQGTYRTAEHMEN